MDSNSIKDMYMKKIIYGIKIEVDHRGKYVY